MDDTDMKLLLMAARITVIDFGYFVAVIDAYSDNVAGLRRVVRQRLEEEENKLKALEEDNCKT